MLLVGASNKWAEKKQDNKCMFKACSFKDHIKHDIDFGVLLSSVSQ